MRTLGFLVVIIVGMYVYMANYSEYVVAEKSCDGGFFIQVNQYLPITKLLGADSEGNVKITFANGTKDYVADVDFIGAGNQKIALFTDKNWGRYVFANHQIFQGTKPFQCY